MIYKIAAVAMAVLAAVSCRNGDEEQLPLNPEITVTGDTLMDAGNGNITLKLVSNAPWTAEVDQEWCSVSPAEGNAGEFDLRVTAQANESDEVRRADLIVRSGSVEDRTEIVQQFEGAIVVADKEYPVPYVGGTLEFRVSANVEFEVVIPEGCDWITRTEPETRAMVEVPLAFVIGANGENEAREAEISFVAGDVKQSVRIIQEGLPDRDVLTVSHTGISFTAPVVTGEYLSDAEIAWGDGDVEEYVAGEEHTYDEEGSYDTQVSAVGIEEITVQSLKGVTYISLSKEE